MLASSVPLHCVRLLDVELQTVGELWFSGVGAPWEFQCSLPQWRTEAILAERLEQVGGSVERGVAVTSLDARDDGAPVSLKHGDGTVEQMDVEWVLGAGGAHSITRTSMDETLVGETYSGTSLVGDVRVRCSLRRDGGNLIAGAEGYVLLVPLPHTEYQPNQVHRT